MKLLPEISCSLNFSLSGAKSPENDKSLLQKELPIKEHNKGVLIFTTFYGFEHQVSWILWTTQGHAFCILHLITC